MELHQYIVKESSINYRNNSMHICLSILYILTYCKNIKKYNFLKKHIRSITILLLFFYKLSTSYSSENLTI